MGLRLFSALAAASLVLAACGGTPAVDTDLRIVTTTSILGDVVGAVVGDAAVVEVLLPVGADPHDFTPSSAQVAAMETADLVVVTGLGLERGLDDVLAAVAEGGATVLEVGPLVDPIGYDGSTCDPSVHDDEHEDGSEEGDAHGACDPHVWMDPLRAAGIAEAVSDALDGIVEGPWSGGAAAFADLMASTDDDIRSELAAVSPEQRVLVTNHDSLGYFAQRYDFEVVGTIVPGGSTLAEPSSRELADLVATMQAAGIDVVFAETTEPTALAEALVAELGAGAAVVELYTGSLGEPGSGAETLAGMLVADARLIADALG